ncbi:hypothetical protein J6590_089076 [Homalodisca vitripennis]|nr:hypothetical protein J6590_089076 [Homalodisca vitripennis]
MECHSSNITHSPAGYRPHQTTEQDLTRHKRQRRFLFEMTSQDFTSKVHVLQRNVGAKHRSRTKRRTN